MKKKKKILNLALRKVGKKNYGKNCKKKKKKKLHKIPPYEA
jgi:hypothetical protein